MKSFATEGDDSKVDGSIQRIITGALGVPIQLDAAPTTAGGQLPKANDFGYYGTNLYINLGGTTYSIALTAV